MKNHFPKIKIIVLIGILLVSFSFHSSSGQITFKELQMRYLRFRVAIKEKKQIVNELFKKKGILYPPQSIFIRVFKEERLVELWAQSQNTNTFSLVRNYKFCAFSGTLGPKREEGDLQIPEGFYLINRFNPQSNHYLSMGINYPNSSDKILGKKGNPGSNIFIIGNCVTWGCIPITKDEIKELYLIVVETYSNSPKNIPVHIFPKRLSTDGFYDLKKRYKRNNELISFWTNLKEGYDIFENNHIIPIIEVEENTGVYKYYFK